MSAGGETWTTEVLGALRAARFRPVAWIRFLACSFERAAEARSRRRREHLQLLLVGGAGVAGWAAVGAVGHVWLALAGAAWVALLVAMVDWHLGMLEDDTGRALRGIGLPNWLAVARGGVVPLLVVLPPVWLVVVLVPAGLGDVVDGRLARARGETSRMGIWLDGGIDAFVLGAAAIGAARDGLVPWWAAALVLFRHSVQWAVLVAAFFVRAEPPPREGFVPAKLPGLVLFAGLVLAVLGVGFGVVLVVLGAVGGIATFVFSVVRSRSV